MVFRCKPILIRDTVVNLLVTHSIACVILGLLSMILNNFFPSTKSFAQTKVYIYCKTYPYIVKTLNLMDF